MDVIQQRAEYFYRETGSPGPTLPQPRRQQERRAPVIARHVTRTNFFCGTGEGFYFNSVQRMVHICSRVISPAEHFRNIMPLYDGGAVVA